MSGTVSAQPPPTTTTAATATTTPQSSPPRSRNRTRVLPRLSRPAVPQRLQRLVRPDNTPGRLRLRMLQAVTAVIATGAFGLALLLLAHGTAVDSVRAARATVDAARAHAELVQTNNDAVRSFLSGEEALAGPGQSFENDFRLATGDLQRLAQDDATGNADLVQQAGANFDSYMALVSQADASNRVDAATKTSSTGHLGYADMLNAANQLHANVLDTVKTIGDDNARALAETGSSVWVSPWILFADAALALAALLLMARCQQYVHRRFRRRLLPAVLVAAAVVVGLSAWLVTGLVHLDGRYSDARDATGTAAAYWHAQADASDADAQLALAALVADPCVDADGGCASTITHTISALIGQQADAKTTAPAYTVLSDVADLQAMTAPLRLDVNSTVTTYHDLAAGLTTRLDRKAVDNVIHSDDAAGGATAFVALAQPPIAQAQQSSATALADASSEGSEFTAVPVLALFAAAMVFLGVKPRLDEYRG